MPDDPTLTIREAARDSELRIEYRRRYGNSPAWHVSVVGPFARPSECLRMRVIDEYRIVGEWRAIPAAAAATEELTMPDDPGRETLAMLARVLADPGNTSREDVLSLVAFAQAAAECANEAEAKLAAATGRARAAVAEADQ